MTPQGFTAWILTMEKSRGQSMRVFGGHTKEHCVFSVDTEKQTQKILQKTYGTHQPETPCTDLV